MQPVNDVRILREYWEVLHRSIFGFHPNDVKALLDYVTDSGLLVVATPLKTTCLTEMMNHFLRWLWPNQEPPLSLAAISLFLLRPAVK